MYAPKHFRVEDRNKLLQYIDEYSFGMLVVADGAGIEVNHVPFHLIRGGENAVGYLQCHLARANSVWRRVQDGAQILAVFQGPNAYVTPGWYPTKAEHGRVVPTWNYLAVHAQGAAQIVEDSDWLGRHVRSLTDRHEAAMATPWSVDDAPAEFTERLLGAIVGVEITIESLTGKLKASQNQPERNRDGVTRGLEDSDGTQAQAMAMFLESTCSADQQSGNHKEVP